MKKAITKKDLRGISDEWICKHELVIDEMNVGEWIDVRNSYFADKIIDVFALILCRRLGRVFVAKDARTIAYNICQSLHLAVSPEYMLRSAAYADNGLNLKIIVNLNIGLDHITIE